jgi:hypothetical protein
MPTLAFFFVGSVLLLNGLVILGRVDARSAAPLNVLIGTIVTGIAIRTAIQAGDPIDPQAFDTVIRSAGSLLFGLTYLYVGIGSFANLSGRGLGWYCGWATGASVFLGLVHYLRLDDPRSGMLWVLWAVLFAAFFVTSGLGRRRYESATGWFTVLAACLTITVPGALMLLGTWDELPTVAVTVAGLVLLVVLVPLALRSEPVEAAAEA